jgi:GTPase SAR1 family protein
MYQNQVYNLHIWDTDDHNDYKNFRPLSYPDSNIFIIEFSLIDSNTFDNIETV